MGMWELILVFAIVVLLFGATRLPALGGALGKMFRNLKSAASEAVKEEPPPPKELPADRDGKGGGTPGG